MAAASPHTAKTTPTHRLPTEYLIRDPGHLTPVMLCRCINKGFALEDVRSMLGVSGLLSNKQIIRRIMGKSSRTIQRQSHSKHPALLTPRQSAVAYQYATIFEHATSVFGTQQFAEEWLARPCMFLDGNVPLEMIDNSIGFLAIEEYLMRIEYGVYQ